MTTVRELIAILGKVAPDAPVHVWTREEEFSDVEVFVDEAESTSGGSGIVCKIRGDVE